MIISIDIGTSYSSICMLGADEKIQPVDISTGISSYGSKYSLPSAVCLNNEGELLVGQAAMNSRIRNPERFRMEFKRDIGQDIPVRLGNTSFMPEDFYTAFFRHMKVCVEKVNSEPIEKAYITYPASFGKKKKEKIMDAAKAAGMFDVELVDEPTAAAMSFVGKKEIKNGQNVLVYDFGGGTFDASLLQYENGGFILLTQPCGIERCGGIDMDRMIYQDIISNIQSVLLEQSKVNSAYWKRQECSLADMSVKAKHHLSTSKTYDEDIEIGFDLFSYQLSREYFEGMIAGIVGQTITVCREILENAGIEVKDLSAVLMIGGTSRIPLVQEMVRQFAGEIPVQCAEDLELAVAEGALKFYDQPGQIPEDCSEENVKYFWLARRGDAEAQFHLGVCYCNGEGIGKNEKEGIKWYERSARQGNKDAQYELGYCYLKGIGTEKNEVEAVKWCQKSAEQGKEEAQCILGYCYDYGIGIKINETEAVRWYREMAGKPCFKHRKEEWAHAMYRLGECYYYGIGVEKNEREAVKCYRELKDTPELLLWDNYSRAMFCLGECYYCGIGVEKNEQEAEECYKLSACNSHDPWELYQLGERFFYGDRVPPNIVEAIKCYVKVIEKSCTSDRGCAKDAMYMVVRWAYEMLEKKIYGIYRLMPLRQMEMFRFDAIAARFERLLTEEEIEINRSDLYEIERNLFDRMESEHFLL